MACDWRTIFDSAYGSSLVPLILSLDAMELHFHSLSQAVRSFAGWIRHEGPRLGVLASAHPDGFASDDVSAQVPRYHASMMSEASVVDPAAYQALLEKVLARRTAPADDPAGAEPGPSTSSAPADHHA